MALLSLNLSLWQSFSTAKISHSKKPKACKQRLMMMSAMRVKQLSQMSENISLKSCKLTSLRAMQAVAPALENTQILSLNGRVKIPKSVSKKMMSASILSLLASIKPAKFSLTYSLSKILLLANISLSLKG